MGKKKQRFLGAKKSPFDVDVFVCIGRDYERAEGELNFAQHEMTHEAP